MKIYLIKDTEYNRMFNNTNDRIGKAYKGVEMGEYIDLQIENNKSIKVLASELKVIEGKKLYVRNEIPKRNKDLKYYGLAVTKKGYQIVIGMNKKTNHINDKEYYIIQDIIIYNNETFEILYSNNNVYMFLSDKTKTFIDVYSHIDVICYGIDKYAEMNEYNKNKALDKLFDMNQLILERLKKECKQAEEKENKIKEDKYYSNAIENIKEGIKTASKVLNDNNIILIDKYAVMLLVKIKDNKAFNHYNNDNCKKYLYDEYFKEYNIYKQFKNDIEVIKIYNDVDIINSANGYKNKYEAYKDIIEYSKSL